MNEPIKFVSINAPPEKSADIPPLPWDRSLSYTDMKVFDECELQYRFRRERRRKAPRDLHQIVGDLTHAGAARVDLAEREAVLKEQIARVPLESQREAERIARELISNADALDTPASDKKKEKVLFKCDAPVVGWVLTAKPDETGFVLTESIHAGTQIRPGNKPGPEPAPPKQVLQLVDLKTGWRLQKKHKDQLFFAAMVAALGQVIANEGPIRLVVRMLRSKTEHVFWYQRSATERNLRRVKAVITRIEQAVASDDFKARTGSHCSSCPYRRDCPAFAAWLESRQDSRDRNSRSSRDSRRRWRQRGTSGNRPRHYRLPVIRGDGGQSPAAGQ